MKVEKAPHGARGVDTVLPFNTSRALAIKAAGYDYVVRYLGPLNTLERNAILAAGLGLLAVNYSRRPGWRPSEALGYLDGYAMVSHARQAGLPEGMTLFIDFEGPGGSAADSIAHINSCATRLQAAGYKAGLYVGYGIQLTDDQMYRALKVTGYWDSCSRNVGVAVRGFQMFQHQPPNVHVAGLQVDLNHIEADAMGDTPSWLIGDP